MKVLVSEIGACHHFPAIEGPRQARCTCGVSRPSDPSLAFFQSTAEGSHSATDTCGRCHYAEAPHNGNTSQAKGFNSHISDHEFIAHGPWTYDTFYCGHAGWD